jgi:Major Facilitator Superfamily
VHTPLEHETFKNELGRSFCAGILDTATSTFLLLIAIQWFHADPLMKGLLVAGTSVGHLVSPFTVYAMRHYGGAPSRAAAFFYIASGLLFLAATYSTDVGSYIYCVVAAVALSSSSVPFITQMYQDNFSSGRRGTLFSRTSMIRIGCAALFAELGGLLLTRALSLYTYLLGAFSAAAFVSALFLFRCPSPLRSHLFPTKALTLMGSIKEVSKDKVFVLTLISWMFLGMGNMMITPLRVEYLSSSQFGHELNAQRIAVYVAVIPNIIRMMLSPMWGHLFDKMNLFVLRIILNLTICAAITTFFLGSDEIQLFIGAVIYGVSMSGSEILWSLWVTKFAPPGKASIYMSVHTFFTGIRGIAAPILAFSLLASTSLPVVVTITTSLIFLGTIILIGEALPKKRNLLK